MTPPTALPAILRRDRLLAVLTCVSTACACAPLFVTRFLPLQDFPTHVALASLMGPSLFGHGLAALHYRVQPVPVPYWTAYLFLAVTGRVLGPLLAAKLLVAVTVVLTPLGVMRLCAALGRSPRLGLLAFALSWDHNMYWGWVAFRLGLALTFFALAAIVEAEDPRAAVRRAGPLALATALTHAQAFGILVVVACALAARRQPWRRLAVHAAGLAPGFVTIAWWLVVMVARHAPATATGPTSEWHDLRAHITNLFAFTLGDVWGPLGRLGARMAFFALLVTPAVLTILKPLRDDDDREWGISAAMLAAVLLYLALPMTIYRPLEQWYIYPRQATFLLLWLLLVPRARLDGLRVLTLAPGILAAALVGIAVTLQFAAFDARSREFQRIVEAVEPDRSLLAIHCDSSDPAIPRYPYDQFHAWITAERRGYDPLLFDNPSHPIVHRVEHKSPAPSGPRADLFSMTAYGRYYDYLLVRCEHDDPIADADGAKRVAEAAGWRLYRTQR